VVLTPARFLVVAVIAVATVLPLSATTVETPTFEQLIADAQQIFVAQTVSRRASWRSSAAGRYIETAVTFRIDAMIKGGFARERTLRFLGGQVGEVRLDVSDMVQFEVGDRDVLFVNDANNPASPIVGFMHGRFRISSDDTVLTHDGLPIAIDSRRGPGRLLAAPNTQSVSLTSFVAQIRSAADAAGISLR
jgi:putative lipoic acid-binding regulatory protein